MPHDLMGQKIVAGDTVTITFEVTEVHQSEDACNLSLRAIRSAAYDGAHLPMVACNSKLVHKVDPTPRIAHKFNMPMVTNPKVAGRCRDCGGSLPSVFNYCPSGDRGSECRA